MRKWTKRILVVLGTLVGLAVVLVAALFVYVSARWDKPVDRSPPTMTAPRDPATIARGEHLYKLSTYCWGCHGSQGGLVVDEPQSGGREFDTSDVGFGFGRYYGTNLTPDPETGIGAWTDGELVRAIREGINRQGQLIFPIMAYPFYHGLSDDDALAIVAYLRSLPPVRHAPPPRHPSFPAKTLIAVGLIKPEPRIGTKVDTPPRGATVEYGRYLAWHASGCAECHTPRSPRDGSIDAARPLAGGLFPFPGEKHVETTGSNLTPDATAGIGSWTEEQFLTAMRSGTRPDGTVMITFMPWPLYSRWEDQDLRAVWLYLRSLEPQAHAVPRTRLHGVAAGGQGLARGEALFEAYCLICHGREGKGTSLYVAGLEDRVIVDDEDGIAETIANGVGKPGSPMPAFGKTLDRSQIADIVAYLKHARPQSLR